MKNVLKYGLTACLAVAFVFGGCKKDEDDAKYSVTLSANNPEMGVVAGGGEFTEGTEIQIMATANSGYHFENWSDGDATNPRTITVDKNIALIAVFAQGTANPQNNGQNPQNGNNDQQQTANGDILPNKVTRIVWSVIDNHGDLSVYTYMFNSEGRTAKYTEEEGGEDYEYSLEYTENSIKGIGRDETTTWGIENGRLATRNSKPKYGYSLDGYLIDAGGERFTVENGLWTKSTYYETYGNGLESNYESKFTYGTNQNNLNVDLMLLLFKVEDYGVFSGLYGNRIKLLPTLIEETETEIRNGEEDVEYKKREFSYEYSGEYITKIIVKKTRDGVVYEHTYEIFY